jgi:selenocysteine-specific translation elongation factor
VSTKYKQLFFLVEGNDDERFFQKIIVPKFQKKYDTVKIWKYAQEKTEKISNFIRSIKSMGADYFYVVDIDQSPCVTAKKKEIKRKLKNVEIDRIIVIIKEIESWYLAGIDNKHCKKLKIQIVENTNNITKEEFNNLIPKKFDRIDFMSEILKNFSIEVAKQKNTSFKYFIEKYDC